MSDKKIIIVAIILAALLIGGGWYYSTHKAPSASISEPQNSGTPSPTEMGIAIGNPDAPITIDEYTNFLCPACASFAANAMPKIMDEYVKTGKAKFNIYIYPPIETSKAGLCAQEQNKFLEYHDYIFSHQSQVADESDLVDFAVNIQMNQQQFSACLISDKYKNKIQKWYDEGNARGIDSTPTFFINGQKFVGAQSYDELKKIIDRQLEAVK
jgi:protein-disulfide isomerase